MVRRSRSLSRPTTERDERMCLAVPGKIIEAEERDGNRIAKVQFGGITRQAFLSFVPEAKVGDYVLVHVGFALSRLDAEEAARTYRLLEQLGMIEEELDSPQPPPPTP